MRFKKRHFKILSIALAVTCGLLLFSMIFIFVYGKIIEFINAKKSHHHQFEHSEGVKCVQCPNDYTTSIFNGTECKNNTMGTYFDLNASDQENDNFTKQSNQNLKLNSLIGDGLMMEETTTTSSNVGGEFDSSTSDYAKIEFTTNNSSNLNSNTSIGTIQKPQPPSSPNGLSDDSNQMETTNSNSLTNEQINSTTQIPSINEQTNDSQVESTSSSSPNTSRILPKPRNSVFPLGQNSTRIEFSTNNKGEIYFEWQVENKTIPVVLNSLSDKFIIPEAQWPTTQILALGNLKFPNSQVQIDRNATYASLGLARNSNESFIDTLIRQNPTMNPQFSFEFVDEGKSGTLTLGKLTFKTPKKRYPITLKMKDSKELSFWFKRIEMGNDSKTLISVNLKSIINLQNEKHLVPSWLLDKIVKKLGLKRSPEGIFCSSKAYKSFRRMNFSFGDHTWSFPNWGYMIQRGNDKFELAFDSNSHMPNANQTFYIGRKFFEMFNLYFDYSKGEIYLGKE